ncbi:MAG: DUF4292 domain-containing protein [Desulfobacterales bacterium]|nr:DUF4292 domain-containing protein [Desulfobacterales bacterium]
MNFFYRAGFYGLFFPKTISFLIKQWGRCICPIIPIILAAFFLSACSCLTVRPLEKTIGSAASGNIFRPETEAYDLILNLKNENDTLKSFKGMGRIKLWNKEKLQTARMAWIGSESGKIRIEILGLSGQPIASLASDGKWFYILYHSQNRFYKKHLNESNFKKLFSIPLKSSEAFDLLAGKVPVHDYHSASLLKKIDGGGYILILEKKCLKAVEKIYFDESKQEVRKIEMFDLRGSLLYRAQLSRINNNGYKIPSRLDIANLNEEGFQLDIEKYWTNIYVSPSTFVLTPPQNEIN